MLNSLVMCKDKAEPLNIVVMCYIMAGRAAVPNDEETLELTDVSALGLF